MVTEDRAAVLAALERGECEGLIPAAVGFLDDFATFLDKHGVLAQFALLPDPRERRSIVVPFFCNVLLHKQLFRLPALADIDRVLFRSPDVLRKLGFNMRQVNEGFYCGSKHKPFDVEALSDFFAAITAKQLQRHQRKLASHLWQRLPVLPQSGVAILDANTTVVPPGHRKRPGTQIKTCVLGLRAAGQVFPVLWDFTDRGVGEDADLTQGKRLIAAARVALGPTAIHHLLVDRGFIDGAWISRLKADGIHTIIGLRENMDLYQDMLGLCQLDDAVWLAAPPPKLPQGPIPQRALCPLSDLDTWDACTAPLVGLVIRDTYPDRVEYQCLVSTDLSLTPEQLHQFHRDRWSIEEGFMDLTRYWPLDKVGSCRPAVARAQIHFLLLAYLLLHLFAHETGLLPEPTPTEAGSFAALTPVRRRRKPRLPRPELLPGREITAYFGDHYTILLPSELVTIILDHIEAWQNNRQQLLAALRFCEGLAPPPRAPD